MTGPSSERTADADALTPSERDEAAVLLLAVGHALGDGMTAEDAVAFARRHVQAVESDPVWAFGRHEGDCTKTPMSCMRCQWETAQADAEWLYEHDLDDARRDLDRLVARNQQLQEALERAADTFADMKLALRLIGHPTSAEAAEIAEDASRAALDGLTDDYIEPPTTCGRDVCPPTNDCRVCR